MQDTNPTFLCSKTGSIVSDEICKQHYALTEKKHKMATNADECKKIWGKKIISDTAGAAN